MPERNAQDLLHSDTVRATITSVASGAEAVRLDPDRGIDASRYTPLSSTKMQKDSITIYTKGDFNKNFADKASYDNRTANPNGTMQPTALMTKGRIYHLSEAWNDAEHKGDVADPLEAGDSSRYSGDPHDETEINACLVDGKPTINEREWVKDARNPYWVDNNHDGLPDDPAAWQNSDDLLEGFGNKVVKKRGSIVHLQNASMCAYDNSDYGAGKTAWVTRSVYIMPIRNYGYDSRVCNPPMAPYIGKKRYWAEY